MKDKVSARSSLRHLKRKSNRSGLAKEPDFGEVILTRRRELDLTRAKLASRIKISTSYVGYLESGSRHPSNLIVTRLAKVLRLDKRELFFLANPYTEASRPVPPDGPEIYVSVWDQFRKDKQLRRILNLSKVEMKMLSEAVVSGCDLGRVRSSRDLIFILNVIRHSVGR